MTSITLECMEDPDYGILGLAVQGVDIYNSTLNVTTDGVLIAHDLLEHQQGVKSIGSLDDELIAFGAIWYVRAQFGSLQKEASFLRVPVDQNMANEIAEFAEKYLYREFESKVPKTNLNMPYELEWIAEEALRIARRAVLEDSDEELDRPTVLARLRRVRFFCRAAQHYMCQGFNKADKRFGNPTAAREMFWSIADAVDPYAKHCEYEGQQFRLNYTMSHAECYEINPETKKRIVSF